MLIEIQNDVPIPTREAPLNLAGALRAMKVGDSFTVPFRKRTSLQYAAWWHRQKPQFKHWRFTTRTVPQPGAETIVRCWRLEDGPAESTSPLTPS